MTESREDKRILRHMPGLTDGSQEKNPLFCYVAVWPMFLLPGQGVYIYISYGIINSYYRDMTGKLSTGMGGLIFATKESWEKTRLTGIIQQ